MSWLRTTSKTLARQLSRSLDPRHDYEPQACYNSFCKHWQQAHDIIQKSQPQHLHDDVLGVVNHLEQLTTLLVLEARAREITHMPAPAACLEYLLSENLLDKLYEWAKYTGIYENAVRLEQLKLFGNLINHYSSQVIAAEPFLRPLLKLLQGFRNQIPPANLESQLVAVLNQLCVVLMQNMRFIDLFFLMTETQNGSQAEFIIGRLLLSSVHREGSAGSVARDAFLLCAKMSAKCPPLAHCLLAGNACPILATGLSGLYSLLPRALGAARLTPDDVNRVHKLTLFIDSLEFCNAVAQVAHPSIRKHLLDLLYQGFLVPVMGPALLQKKAGPLQSECVEQMTAMTYLELLLRCISSGGLLRVVLHFLFSYEYDGVKVIDVLLGRLEGNNQLSLVTLCLMETLIDLNCEDVMIELVYKYLINGNHLMAVYTNKLNDPEPYREAAVSLLGLSPKCCSRPVEKTKEWVDELALSGRRVLDFKRDDDNRRMNGVHGEIAMNNLVHEVNFDYGNPNETLYHNYHAYLCDARYEIVSRTIACANWSFKYDSIPKREANNNTKEMKETETQIPLREQDSLVSLCTSGYNTFKTSDTSEKEPYSLNSLNEIAENKVSEKNSTDDECKTNEDDANKSDSEKENHSLGSLSEVDNSKEIETKCTENDMNKTSDEKLSILNEVSNEEHNEANDAKDRESITSIESSGYDSFKYRLDDNEDEGFAEDAFRKNFAKSDVTLKDLREYDEIAIRNWRASPESIIGPLLHRLLKKASNFLESDVTTTCRVSSVLCKLAALPTPLLTTLLLCPGSVLQPNVPSLFQILSRLKEELDELTEGLENSSELVDKARVFLIQREMTLVNSRAQTNDDSQAQAQQPARDDSPFRRTESKRRSFSSSLSNIFNRKTSLSPSQQNSQSLQSSGYNSPLQKRPIFTQEAYWNQSITLRSVLNAVILDEWLKELSALCEEQALRLSADNYENDTYIRTVAL